MSRLAIIIPVRGSEPKRRFSSLFTPKQRKQFQLAMLEDILQTVIKTGMVDRTFLISSDQDILRFAERYGSHSVQEDGDTGVNEAVRKAIAALQDYDGWMVIPADLPLLNPVDIKMARDMMKMGADVVISPSEERDGTNLLLITRGTPFELHYDDDSFNRHLKQANERGLRVAVYYSERVAFDLDRAGDVHRFFKFGGRRSSTMTFLVRTLRGSQRVEQKMREDERPHPD